MLQGGTPSRVAPNPALCRPSARNQISSPSRSITLRCLPDPARLSCPLRDMLPAIRGARHETGDLLSPALLLLLRHISRSQVGQSADPARGLVMNISERLSFSPARHGPPAPRPSPLSTNLSCAAAGSGHEWRRSQRHAAKPVLRPARPFDGRARVLVRPPSADSAAAASPAAASPTLCAHNRRDLGPTSSISEHFDDHRGPALGCRGRGLVLHATFPALLEPHRGPKISGMHMQRPWSTYLPRVEYRSAQ